jgi:hypothetical protein
MKMKKKTQEFNMNEEEIGNFIDAIAAQNFNQAKNHFDEILGNKIADSLEQEKAVVANTIFNGVDDDDEEDFEDFEDDDEEDFEDDEDEDS